MKKYSILAVVLLVWLGVSTLHAQNVGINDDNSQPDNSAILDVKSVGKGMLIPRMTEAQKLGISSPATGLTVYQTDGISGFYYYETYWKLIGSNANFVASNYLYNTKTGVKWLATNDADDVDFVISPKRYGAIIANLPDGTATGGNNRGIIKNIFIFNCS